MVANAAGGNRMPNTLESDPMGLVAPGRRFSVSSNVIPGVVLSVDSLTILATGYLTYLAVVGGMVEDPNYYAAAIAFIWLVTITLMNFGGLYEFDSILNPISSLSRFALAFATAFLFLMAAAFSLKVATDYSRLWTGSFAFGAATATILVRLVASRIIGSLVDHRVLSRNMVVVGAGEQIRRFLTNIEMSQPRFVSLLGVFSDEPKGLQEIHFPVLGRYDDISSFIRANDVDDVVISLPWSEDEQITVLSNKLREVPVNVYLGADLIGFRLQFRKPPEHFGQLPLVEVLGRPLAGWSAFLKAAFDYGLGLLLTVILLPVMVLIAIAIRLESPGPVLFRQERYGFANRIFHIYKFRTMFHRPSFEGRTVQATRYDPRVTRLGYILRRFSLDELPQLFNVLNGTMSLIGPRPHAVDHNEEYSRTIRGYFARHRVKPGLSGWAQVNGFRGEIKTLDEMKARINYDVYYVENWSLLFDLKILAMTAVVCLAGRNAY
jgi:Undecaprenyl-phosphate glucose phosphotransferase